MPRPDPPLRKGSAAFVLLEVLISVGVLATGVVIALSALRAGARIQDTAEKHLQAVYLLEETVALFQGAETLRPGTYEGACESPNENFQWSVSVSNTTEFGDLVGGLLLIDAEVAWNDRGEEREVSATSLAWKRGGAE
jgi:hypothetical protein